MGRRVGIWMVGGSEFFWNKLRKCGSCEEAPSHAPSLQRIEPLIANYQQKMYQETEPTRHFPDLRSTEYYILSTLVPQTKTMTTLKTSRISSKPDVQEPKPKP